jgi:AraC-like DNA-binding protein
MTLNELDLLLRGGALGLCALFALQVVRLADARLRWLGLGISLSVAAFLLLGSFRADMSPMTRLTLRLVAIPGIYCLWALSRIAFEDRFEPRPWHAVLVAAMLLTGGGAVLADVASPPALRLLRATFQLTALALCLQVLWRVLRDRNDDLIETRRRARVSFGIGAAVALAIVFPRWLWDSSPLLVARVPIVQALTFFGLALVLLALASELRRPAFVLLTERRKQIHEPKQASEEERLDAERVLAAMREQRRYRENGLAIGTLARQLAIPEYRLRRAINRDLGYRNFNDFLNAWRLPEAQARLRDPAQAHLPILSIALEIGYASIGPFNRAFKAATGLTPSEYRRGGRPEKT